MSKEFENFYSGFRSDIIDLANSDEGYPQKEQAFTALVTEDLSQAGILESPDVCYFEQGSGNTLKKANAYSVPEEDTSLDLLITLYHGKNKPETINNQDIERAFNQLARFLKAGMDGHYENTEPGSEAFQMLHRIYGLKDEIDRVRFFLITDAQISVRSDKRKKDNINGLPVSYEIWHIERIFRFRNQSATHEPVELDLSDLPTGGLACTSTSNLNLGYDTLCAIIPGSVLAALYDEYGQRLLELNVRSYLQARGKVNKGIMETLFETPERFLAYNNGITIVAEEMKTGKLKDGSLGITRIKGLQIVNGGQTTASIHRSSKKEKTGKYKDRAADLVKVSVQAKITVIEPKQFEELVPLISKFSNTQNKVTEVDLRANHPFHTGIERVSRKMWAPGEKCMWYYERARGSYQTDKAREATTPAKKKEFEIRYPTSQRFTPTDLAKYSNCWNQHPYIASKGGQKSFVYFMQDIGKKDDDWQPSDEEYKAHVGRSILYKDIYKICREVGYKGQQVHCCNYTVALITKRTAKRVNLQQIWNRQSISEALEQNVREWAPLIMKEMADSAGTRNPTEWYKDPKCWEVVQRMNIPLSSELQAELISVNDPAKAVSSKDQSKKSKKRKPQKLTHEDENNIARCRETSAERWLKIVSWGKSTGALETKQLGIAGSMASLAASGWPDEKPTKAQAWHGVVMLEAAKENDI